MKMIARIKHLVLLSVILAMGSLFAGPKVTIIGDSYSTWAALEPPYYPAAYNGSYNGVIDASQLYWSMFINHVGGELCVLNAWSGSFLAKRPTVSHYSFVDQVRLDNLGEADIVVICGGTNDAWGSDGYDRVAIGEEKYGNWEDDDLKTFFPALTYLVCEVKKRLPNADIVIVANSYDDYRDSGSTHKDVGIARAYCEAMQTVADHYGLCFVQCSGIEKNDNHPTVKGFATMGAQLNAAWDKYVAATASKPHAFTLVSRSSAVAPTPIADFGAATVEASQVSDGMVYRFLDTAAPIEFTLNRAAQLSWALVVGGGGAGGGNCGGGGGAGGLLDLDWRAEPMALAAGSKLMVTVGAGGVGNSDDKTPGASGENSSLQIGDQTYTAFGGGGGGSYNSTSGAAGGCGGGGVNGGAGASTMSGEFGYGNAGGTGYWNNGMPAAGGGGGAMGAGVAGVNKKSGDGGNGYSCEITDSPVVYAGGGGAGALSLSVANASCGSGGIGGGGAGGVAENGYGKNGTPGLGGGGGGACGGIAQCGGGSGGSGVVILRFPETDLNVSATVSATNSIHAMTVDLMLVSVGEGATKATIYLAYGEGEVGTPILLGTLAQGESGHYEIEGLNAGTDYKLQLTAVNDAENPTTVTLAATARTLDPTDEMKPVITLTATDLQPTSARFSIALQQVGEGSATAGVFARLTAGGIAGEWTTLEDAASAGWSTVVDLTDLQPEVSYFYEVKALNSNGIEVFMSEAWPVPDASEGRTVIISEKIRDANDNLVKVRLGFGAAGEVFSNTKLYVAYAAADAGEQREDWEHCEFVADIPNDVFSYECGLPVGWGTDYFAIRFFTVSDAASSALTYDDTNMHARWDAIDNAGSGLHVEQSSTWVNLVDSTHNLSCNSAVSFDKAGVEVGPGYFSVTTERDWWTALGNKYSWEAYVTLKPALKNRQSYSPTLMGSLSGNGSLHALFCQYNSESSGWGFYEMNTKGIGAVGVPASAIPCDGETPVHLAYVVTPDGAKVYIDGILINQVNESMIAFNDESQSGVVSMPTFVVGTGYDQNRYTYATIHAIRLYTDALTEERLQENLAIDRQRFNNKVVAASELIENDQLRLVVEVTPFTPTTAWVDYALGNVGFGATKADVFLSFGEGVLGERMKIGTLSQEHPAGRRLIENLSAGATYVYCVEAQNNATSTGSWAQNGEFDLQFDPVEPIDSGLRQMTLEPKGQSVKINFGEADYEGTFSLYACYGAAASLGEKDSWENGVKIADVPASMTSFTWKYPSGWGKTSGALRFFLVGEGKEYAVHEYIDSTGSQYVYTGLTPKESMSYAGKVQYLGKNSLTGSKWVTLYGCYVTGDQCLFWYNGDFYFNNSGNYNVSGIGTGVCEFSTTDYVSTRSPRTSMTANGRTVNGTANWSAKLTAESMPLFAFDYSGVITTCNSDIRLYNFKAYDNGVLVRDFVPIVKDGVPMLYDRANGDAEHGPFYPRNDNGEAEFVISEATTGEMVGGNVSYSASSVVYYDASMRASGFVIIVK